MFFYLDFARFKVIVPVMLNVKFLLFELWLILRVLIALPDHDLPRSKHVWKTEITTNMTNLSVICHYKI